MVVAKVKLAYIQVITKHILEMQQCRFYIITVF